MECRSYIRVYRQVKPFISNFVVFPDGSTYEMNDQPNHPTYGVCMYYDTVNNIHGDSRKLGKLYRDLTKLPDTVQNQINGMVKSEPSFMNKGCAIA